MVRAGQERPTYQGIILLTKLILKRSLTVPGVQYGLLACFQSILPFATSSVKTIGKQSEVNSQRRPCTPCAPVESRGQSRPDAGPHPHTVQACPELEQSLARYCAAQRGRLSRELSTGTDHEKRQ